MKEEKLSLLQRCIKWRENNIKEKQFILILSFLVGIFTAFAALLLKFFIHQIQNFLICISLVAYLYTQLLNIQIEKDNHIHSAVLYVLLIYL